MNDDDIYLYNAGVYVRTTEYDCIIHLYIITIIFYRYNFFPATGLFIFIPTLNI